MALHTGKGLSFPVALVSIIPIVYIWMPIDLNIVMLASRGLLLSNGGSSPFAMDMDI